jgi:hypothetical protein
MAPPSSSSNPKAFFSALSSSFNGNESNKGGADSVEMSSSLESAWAQAKAKAKAAVTQGKALGLAAASSAGIAVPASMQAVPDNDEESLVGGAVGDVHEEMCKLCPALTYKQRVIGAACCVGFGFMLDIMASLTLFLGKAHVTDFAVFYTLGNLTAICGSGFLVGPARQLKTMCDATRRVACTVYLATMVLTIVAAVLHPDVLLVFALLVIQYAALIWYGASFIPFGRTCLLKAVKAAGGATKKCTGLE